MAQTMTEKSMAEAKAFASSVYDVSLDNIQMALALSVAFAWHTAIKEIVKRFWKSENSVTAYLVYAIIMTALFVAAMIFAKRVLNYNKDPRQITYAMAAF